MKFLLSYDSTTGEVFWLNPTDCSRITPGQNGTPLLVTEATVKDLIKACFQKLRDCLIA